MSVWINQQANRKKTLEARGENEHHYIFVLFFVNICLPDSICLDVEIFFILFMQHTLLEYILLIIKSFLLWKENGEQYIMLKR